MTSIPKKGLYHSELVKMGEVTVKVTSEPTPSKYEGKPPFVALEIDGHERLYNVENERCEGKLLLRKGQVLTLKATGGRENADIEILSGNEHPDKSSGGHADDGNRSQAPSPVQTSVRSTSTGAGGVGGGGYSNESNKNTLARCIDDAIAVLDDRLTAITEAATPDARLDAVLRIGLSLFIQSHK